MNTQKNQQQQRRRQQCFFFSFLHCGWLQACRAWPLRLCRFGLLFCHRGFSLAFGSTALAFPLWLRGFGFQASASRLQHCGFILSIWLSSARISHRSFDFIAWALLLGLRLRLCDATFGFTASGSLFLSLWFLFRDFDFRASALQLWLHKLGLARFRTCCFVYHCCCRCWRRLCWCSAS